MDLRDKPLRDFENATELPLLALALAVIPLVVIPLVKSVSADIEDAIDWALVVITGVFVVELGIRARLTSDPPLRYLRKNWPDLLIIAAALPIDNIGPLGLARSARALRVLRLTRAAPFLSRAYRDALAILKRRGLRYILLSFVLTIVASAGLALLFEREAGAIDDYGTALWWAVGTTTGVGSGDAVPSTAEGRTLAVVLGLVSILFVAWFTAVVAAFLVEHGGTSAEGVTLAEVMQKLEDIEAEVRQLRASSDNLQ